MVVVVGDQEWHMGPKEGLEAGPVANKAGLDLTYGSGKERTRPLSFNPQTSLS